jgi:hypothetical protein
MDQTFWRYFNLAVRALNAAALVKWLVVFAAASGAVVTVGALWQQVPWYTAITTGAVLFAALVMAILGIDHLRRIHGIRGKIQVTNVRTRAISLNPNTNRLDFELSIHVLNNSTRPLWISLDRAQCVIDLQSHIPLDLLPAANEVQPANHRSIRMPIISLDPSKSEFEGWVELEARYGKKKDKYLRSPYKTKGLITVNVANTPLGWTANIVTTGGTASWD